MRIGRFAADGEDRIGRFEEESVVDVTDAVADFQEALLNPGALVDVEGESFSSEEITYQPPTTAKNSVFCSALNYEAHAEEGGTVVPDRPLIFFKLPRTLVGHEQPISYHTPVTQKIDYEAELAAIIGEPTRYVEPDEALEYVAGYTILNDTSARDLQIDLGVGDRVHVDWFSGKAMQETTPLGPNVVIDEIDDPQELRIASRVNGETMQDDTTANMIASVAELVAYLSSRVELSPGDVIATGTPEGVGVFQDIQLYEDDEVEIEIEGIGTLKNTVQAVEK